MPRQPSISCQTHLPAIDEAKAMLSVLGHCKVVIPEVLDYEHAYERIASEHSHSLWAVLSHCMLCELQVHIGQIHPNIDTNGSNIPCVPA